MKETSKQAYEQIKPQLTGQQTKVLDALRHCQMYEEGGDIGFNTDQWGALKNHTSWVGSGLCTSQSLATLFRLDYHMVARRMPELEKLGLVKDSGKRGKTSSGRSAVIWELLK